MPVIHIQDAFGYNYQIHSANPDTVAAWLLEHIRKMNSANAQYMNCQIRTYPAWVADPKTEQLVPDWPINDQTWFMKPADMLDRIIEILTEAKDKTK
jgi:hypothetical protein